MTDAATRGGDVKQIGPEQEGFFDFYVKELKPRLGL
jgi:hypothetical protein